MIVQGSSDGPYHQTAPKSPEFSDQIDRRHARSTEHARSTVHNWVQKAELQPEGGKSPDHVAVDETVIQVNHERFWLYAAVDPETNEFLHVRLFPSRTTALTKLFLRELQRASQKGSHTSALSCGCDPRNRPL
jgi:transposase-like protein